MRPLFHTLLVVLALIIGACRKPAPLDTTAPSTTTRAGPETTDAAELERRYPTLADPAERWDTLHALPGAPPAEAVAAIGRLLAFEKDPELRAGMIEVLADLDGEEPARLAILAPLTGNMSEPGEVREAALAALEKIDDPAAIPVWEKLLAHPDAAVREIAHARLDELRESLPK